MVSDLLAALLALVRHARDTVRVACVEAVVVHALGAAPRAVLKQGHALPRLAERGHLRIGPGVLYVHIIAL